MGEGARGWGGGKAPAIAVARPTFLDTLLWLGQRGRPVGWGPPARPQPARYDDTMLERDLALIRERGQSRRSLPADILEEIAADPEMSPAKKAHLRRLHMAMPEGP
jgi:hypothetical protein